MRKIIVPICICLLLTACGAESLTLPSAEKLAAEFRGTPVTALKAVRPEEASFAENEICFFEDHVDILADIWGADVDQFEVFFVNTETGMVHRGQPRNVEAGGTVVRKDGSVSISMSFATTPDGLDKAADDIAEVALSLASGSDIEIAPASIPYSCFFVGLEEQLPEGSYRLYVQRHPAGEEIVSAPEGTTEDQKWIFRFAL